MISIIGIHNAWQRKFKAISYDRTFLPTASVGAYSVPQSHWAQDTGQDGTDFGFSQLPLGHLVVVFYRYIPQEQVKGLTYIFNTEQTMCVAYGRVTQSLQGQGYLYNLWSYMVLDTPCNNVIMRYQFSNYQSGGATAPIGITPKSIRSGGYLLATAVSTQAPATLKVGDEIVPYIASAGNTSLYGSNGLRYYSTTSFPQTAYLTAFIDYGYFSLLELTSGI